MAAPGIAVTITAVDKTTDALTKINNRIEAFSKKTAARVDQVTAPFKRLGQQVVRFGEVSGLKRVGSAFGKIGRSAAGAFREVSHLVPLIGAIGSAATVAGITRMVTAWADWGSRIGFASQRLGITAQSLSAFDGAARLAGASTESMTSGLQSLGQAIYDSVGGRNTEAIVMFRTLGVAFADASGHARNVADVLPEIADKIAAIKDPFAQAQAATTLFGGAAEQLLPFLRKGSAGIREYTQTATRYGVINDAAAAAANRLREAQTKVGLATEGLSNRISERLEPILTPLLTHFAEWLATSPQVAHGVEWLGTKVGDLAAWLEHFDWDGFGQRVERWGAPISSVVHLLGGSDGIQGTLEGLMAFVAASFTLKLIMPFLQLGTAITSTIVKLGVLIARSRLATEALAETGAAKGAADALSAGGTGMAKGLLGKMGFLLPFIQDYFDGTTDKRVAESSRNLNSPLYIAPDGSTPNIIQFGTGPSAGGNPNLAGRGVSGGAQHDTSQPSGRNANTRVAPQQMSFDTTLTPQARGLLDTISGTESSGRYNVEYGGQTFSDYSQHPNVANPITSGPNAGKTSSAAGRYQFLKSTWDEAAAALGLKDFSPASQDKAAWWLAQRDYNAKTGHALSDDIKSTDPAVRAQIGAALHSTWTSLPGGIEAGTNDDRFSNQLASNINRETLSAPQAQGPELQLASNSAGNDDDSKSTVRVEFGGQLPQGLNMKLNNPQGVDVGGPLVERPMLLGANA